MQMRRHRKYIREIKKKKREKNEENQEKVWGCTYSAEVRKRNAAFAETAFLRGRCRRLVTILCVKIESICVGVERSKISVVWKRWRWFTNGARWWNISSFHPLARERCFSLYSILSALSFQWLAYQYGKERERKQRERITFCFTYSLIVQTAVLIVIPGQRDD